VQRTLDEISANSKEVKLMLGIQHYSVFILSGLILNVTPGNDTIYILGRTLSQGRIAGVVSVLGIVSGALVHTLLAAVGLSIILMKSAIAFNMLKWFGAGYLIYLGTMSLLSRQSGSVTIESHEKTMIKKIYLQGFLTNVLNPKVAIFFLAFLPQFIAQDNTDGTLPFIILGLTFITTGTIWCMILVITSDTMSRTIKKTKISKHLSKLTGFLYIFLGLKLLGESRV
jgi:threonine/homoserine/homoserine lactone efflux protein